MECIHKTSFLLKSKTKNHQELILLLTIYTTSNSVAVNILVGIALTQFVAFTVYQSALFGKVEEAICILLLSELILAWFFDFALTHAPEESQQTLQLRSTVLDVAHDYKEFEELLIGLDE